MPVQAAVDKFGFENFSRSTQNLFKKEPFEEIELVHVVRPRGIYNERKESDKYTEKQRVTPKQGTAVMFDGRYLHTAYQPKKNMRCIINFNIDGSYEENSKYANS